jgi:thiamine kinase-like enzyme
VIGEPSGAVVTQHGMDSLVAEVLAEEQLAVVACTRISEFSPSRTARHAYRVTLSDGCIVKARRTLSEMRAQAVCDALSALDDDRFARVLARRGAVLIEEWVDGKPLTSEAPRDDHLREAAALLARIHAVSVVADACVRSEQPTRHRLAATEARLSALTAAGALSRIDVEVLEDALRRADPGRAQAGLVHLDFAFENMVLDPQGRLRMIDNEAMSVDAFDYDLARSWYRSAMVPQTWARFEDVYRRAGGVGAQDHSAEFWRIAAVVEGAVTRLEVDPSRVAIPLDRLRDMAADLRHRSSRTTQR